MRINRCPSGEKCAYQRSLLTAAFAFMAVSFMSLMGAPGTRAQAQTPQAPCTQSPALAPTTTVTNEELVSGPSTMGVIDGRFGFRAFDGGFSTLSGVSSYTIVGSAYEALMTEIFGIPSPTTVAVNDPNQGNAGVPCVAPVSAKR
jgi:hypothetical protein